MSSWAAALRIARRDVRRAKGRSALVLAMIVLPLLGITALDVAARTYELSPEQRATRDIGAADAALRDTGGGPIVQYGYKDLLTYDSQGSSSPRPPIADLSALAPAGSRTLTDDRTTGRVSAADRSVTVDVRALDYTDPLAAGIYRQASGRAPRATDEVALTPALARQLGVALGSDVTVAATRRTARVVGIVDDGDDKAALTALVSAGSLGSDASRRVLVDLPTALDWSQVVPLNARGVLVTGRGSIPGAPPLPLGAGRLIDAQQVTAISLVAGLALLEIVLLAGPAFAVGTKRQAHELALIAATGGDRRDVRRVVLGGGLVLGLVAGVVGVAGGIALGALSEPLVSRFDSSVPGPLDVRPLEVLAIVVVGVVTALLAAMLPALLASRQDVVAALTGRRGVRRGSRLVPVAGVVATAAGMLIVLNGAHKRDLNIVLAGSIVAELGLVALTPIFVGLAGRLGPLLPAAPRLALRDASRNRGRTAPAVSAILAAVAGSVAVATVLSSIDEKDRRDYRADAVVGTVVVQVPGSSTVIPSIPSIPAITKVLQRALPSAEVVQVRRLTPSADGAPLSLQVLAVGCCGATGPASFQTSFQTSVGDGRTVAALTGSVNRAYDAVLARGGVIAPAGYVTRDGTATLTYTSPGTDPRPRQLVLPAVALADDAQQQGVIVSAAAARQLGAPTEVASVIALPGRVISTTEQARIQAALDAPELAAAVQVERGFHSHYGAVLYLLVGASALLVLGASGMATGLAAADGRGDLSTLAAVGATPGLRRRLAGFQSIVTAGLGTVLGVIAGVVPALGLIGALNTPIGAGGSVFATGSYPFVIPWTNLLITVIAVPTVAGAGAMALTRSRLPLVRRPA